MGDSVAGLLTAHGTERVYTLTAPANGTLVLRLGWESCRGTLELWVGDAPLALSKTPPVEVRLAVIAGQQYRIRVADAAAWDYDDLYLPFVLTTSIE